MHVADNLGRSGDWKAALEQYRQALPLVESLSCDDPANVQRASDLALFYERLGTAQAHTGQARDALDILHRSLAMLERVLPGDPESLMTRSRIANSQAGLGYAHAALGGDRTLETADRVRHWREARKGFQQAMELYLEARNKGATTGYEAEKPDEFARQMAKCDAELAKLGAAASQPSKQGALRSTQ